MGAGASVETLSKDEIATIVSKFGPEFTGYNDPIITNDVDGKLLMENHTSGLYLDSLFESLEVVEETHKRKMRKEFSRMTLPPIRLIDFEVFKMFGNFPRFPENKDLVTSLDKINREESLIVFLSHCWLRGHPAAEGWDGRPHPDNANGDKFQLCVSGLQHIADNLAPGMKKCYIWLDFVCIDQDSSACAELKMLKQIVECTDMLFTPIYDPTPDWEFDFIHDNYYDNYQAKLWNWGPHAYLNRGWCRVEMFYAANIPLFEGNYSPDNVPRHTKFFGGLAFHCEHNRRPHFIYGNKEMKTKAPICLPPLQNAWFQKYHPGYGSLTQASDQVHIDALVEEIRPYMREVQVGFVGETDENNCRQGYGVLTWPNGDVYKGHFKDNKFHGQGEYIEASGDMYIGMYDNDQKHGKGIIKFTDGHSYEGDFQNDLKHGVGKNIYLSLGLTYEGEWENDMKHGQGVLTNTTKNDYLSGEWVKYPAGSVYSGGWIENDRSGHGTMTFSNGDVFEGEWLDGKRNGPGVLKQSDNTVIQEGTLE